MKHILQRIEASVANIEQDIIEDNNYEMKDEYNFSDGIRGRFYEPKKISTSMRLDNDILIFLKKQAGEKKITYQTLIHNPLREYMQKEGLDAS